MKEYLSTVRRHYKYYRLMKQANAIHQGQFLKTAEVTVVDIQSFFKQLKPMNCGIPMVRIGSAFDGGYVMPDDLEGIVASFSPGVSHMLDFDLEIAQRGIKCFLADASVDKLVSNHELFDFEERFLGGKTQNEYMTLNDWVGRKAPACGDLLLQMDIEGAEYDTLEATDDETLKRFRQIVLEVHNFQRVFKKHGLARLQALFARLSEYFIIVHLHYNNNLPLLTVSGLQFPRVFEITFLRKDRVRKLSVDVTIPHALDAPNARRLPDTPIPKFWL